MESTSPKKIPTYIFGIWFTLLLVAPILLWILPADYFDSGQSLCPSQMIFSIECFGCGITRAIQHLHHFEVEEALFYHTLSPLIYLFLAYLWFKWIAQAASRLGFLGEERRLASEEKSRKLLQKRLERKASMEAKDS